ncbi:hypothetical protein DOY81_008085 [Sarcophaga bullata]|nr:hypothetical protein DOY81_008085 [Sarcophaga bullata]
MRNSSSSSTDEKSMSCANISSILAWLSNDVNHMTCVIKSLYY